MTRPAAVVLLLSLCSLLIGCPSHPRPLDQPQTIFSEGAYTHEKSGMTFPIAVGEFQRMKIQRYDHDGLDMSVGYDLINSQQQIIATVYIYPAPPLTSIGSPPETIAIARSSLEKNEFEARKREILQSRLGARLLEDTEISIPIGGAVHDGRIASFEYDEKFLGEKEPLRSHLCIFNFIGGKWTLKYRITYPRRLEATREIDTILQGVPWNVPND